MASLLLCPPGTVVGGWGAGQPWSNKGGQCSYTTGRSKPVSPICILILWGKGPWADAQQIKAMMHWLSWNWDTGCAWGSQLQWKLKGGWWEKREGQLDPNRSYREQCEFITSRGQTPAGSPGGTGLSTSQKTQVPTWDQGGSLHLWDPVGPPHVPDTVLEKNKLEWAVRNRTAISPSFSPINWLKSRDCIHYCFKQIGIEWNWTKI